MNSSLLQTLLLAADPFWLSVDAEDYKTKKSGSSSRKIGILTQAVE